MKEVFLQHNITPKEEAKSLFEEQWMASTARNQNKPKKVSQMSLLKQGASAGSGYAYPGFAWPVSYSQDEEDAVQE